MYTYFSGVGVGAGGNGGGDKALLLGQAQSFSHALLC